MQFEEDFKITLDSSAIDNVELQSIGNISHITRKMISGIEKIGIRY